MVCHQTTARKTGLFLSKKMKFELIDQIIELEPSKRIHTVKNVSLAEEYLGDHFP